MRAPTYLRKTKIGTFYFRVAIPRKFQALSDDIPREVRISLRTNLISVAAARARKIGTLYQESFSEMGELTGKEGVEVLRKLLAENKAKADLKKAENKEKNLKDYLDALQKLNPHAVLNANGEVLLPPPNTQIIQRELNLTELIEKFITERDRVSKWSDKSREETVSKLNLFVRIVTDLPVSQLNAETVRKYREIIQKLPPNLKKIPRYRNKSITEIIAMDDVEPMELRTLGKNLEKVKTFLKWGHEQELIPKNLLPILTVKITNKSSDKKRDAFSVSDLEAIFYSPEMLGTAKKSLTKPHQFWVPVISLLTGARIEEICQLYVDDITKVDKLWCISINNQGEKKLKNEASKRVIPVSSILIDLGFIDYVQQCKKLKRDRLFSELSRSRDGYSPIVSKWFATYKKRHGIVSPRKVFHSFRHTVISFLQDKGYPEPKVAAFVGHALENVTFGVYGKGFSPASLKEIAEAVDFGLDQKKLKQAAKRFTP